MLSSISSSSPARATHQQRRTADDEVDDDGHRINRSVTLERTSRHLNLGRVG